MVSCSATNFFFLLASLYIETATIKIHGIEGLTISELNEEILNGGNL